VCLLDLAESRDWPTYIHGFLCRGLAALARHYGLLEPVETETSARLASG